MQHYVNLATYSVLYALPSVFCGSFDKTFLLSDTFSEIILSSMTSFTESVVLATFGEIRFSTMTSLIYRECYQMHSAKELATGPTGVSVAES